MLIIFTDTYSDVIKFAECYVNVFTIDILTVEI
jgi:hypothetical protein